MVNTRRTIRSETNQGKNCIGHLTITPKINQKRQTV